MTDAAFSSYTSSLARLPPYKIPPLSLTCSCREITLPLLSISKHATLPLPMELCHCNSCRYSSGALTGAFIWLKSSPPQESLAKCIEYPSSAKVSRYFCAKCGSQTFLRGWSHDEPVLWFAWAGMVERGDPVGRRGASAALPSAGEAQGRRSSVAAVPEVDLVTIEMQAFVEDTRDGGLVGRMCKVARDREEVSARRESTVGLEVPVQRPRERRRSSLAKMLGKVKGEKKEEKEEVKVDDGSFKTVFMGVWGQETVNIDEIEAFIKKSKELSTGMYSERLLAQCHCGRVQFHVTRPDRSKNYPEHVQYYLKGDRYFGRLCTCRSCRTATGIPLMAWVYVPPENIQTVDGMPIKFKIPGSLARLGITRIRKSDGQVLRSFCEACGATIFYEHTGRSWVVNVAPGILRSESGALAEDFVEWNWEEVSCMEECQSKTFLRSVAGDGVRELEQ